MKLTVGLDYRPALLTSVGIARYARELALALGRREDVELHLFAHCLARPTRDDPVPPGAVLHRSRLPGRALPWLTRLGWPAPRLCGRVQVFHWTDYVHPPVGRTPAVLTVHDVAFADDPTLHGARQSAELLERTRRAAARARAVIVPTRATAEALARHVEVDADKLHIVPYGADHLRGGAAGDRPHDAPYIVALGTIEPRKNHRRLLAAWRGLKPRPHLVVIGRRGWECDDIVAELHAAQGEGDLQWHEDMDDASVRRYLRHAELLAYPSLQEGFGFPPFEAIALGTPVVAGDNTCLREVLGGDGAELCDPHDIDAIRAGLARVLSDADRRERLLHRGRERLATYTWDRCAAGHVAAYRGAAG